MMTWEKKVGREYLCDPLGVGAEKEGRLQQVEGISEGHQSLWFPGLCVLFPFYS